MEGLCLCGGLWWLWVAMTKRWGQAGRPQGCSLQTQGSGPAALEELWLWLYHLGRGLTCGPLAHAACTEAIPQPHSAEPPGQGDVLEGGSPFQNPPGASTWMQLCVRASVSVQGDSRLSQ